MISAVELTDWINEDKSVCFEFQSTKSVNIENYFEDVKLKSLMHVGFGLHVVNLYILLSALCHMKH